MLPDQKQANLLLILLLSLLIIIIFELVAKLSLRTFLKDKITSENLKTEFEEIFIPPFEEKKPEEFRVFVYGGSTVQGVPLPKTGFVNQLQYQLHKVFDYKDVKVYNFGWAGFNSTRIRYLFNRTISQKPDLVIIYTGENEFIYPQLDYYLLVRAVTALKNRSDLAKIILSSAQSRNTQKPLSSQKFPAYGDNKFYVSLKMNIFQNNLLAITRAAKKSRIPLILAIPGHNIADWPPVKRETTENGVSISYQQGVQIARQLIDQRDYQMAKDWINYHLTQYPDDASLLFLKGTVLEKQGEPSYAYEIFQKAKDNDLVPWRTTTSHANFIKSLDDHKNVWVVDFAEVFRENSKDQLPGFNFFLDGTHPNKEGAYLIAKTLSDFIILEKLVYPEWLKDIKDPFPSQDLFKFMQITKEDDFFTFTKSAALALKIPLMNFDAAQYFIEKAEEIDNKNWETRAIKAAMSHLKGDDQKTMVLLKEAEKLKGAALSQQETESIPYLSEILEYQP
ncbi:SGNH/GDSL hydrolase family protein [Candidatus Curtissbacteria bacterium]|nr:SGNH/GDSL hydrolase family protein [Candidatus Curtissbacteria bacterium]